MWTPLNTVCTRMCWKCQQTLLPLRIPYLDRTIPRGRGKGGLGGQIPSAGKGFAAMLLECSYGKLGLQRRVIQPQRSIAGGRYDVCRMCFGVRKVVKGVLGGVPARLAVAEQSGEWLTISDTVCPAESVPICIVSHFQRDRSWQTPLPRCGCRRRASTGLRSPGSLVYETRAWRARKSCFVVAVGYHVANSLYGSSGIQALLSEAGNGHDV